VTVGTTPAIARAIPKTSPNYSESHVFPLMPKWASLQYRILRAEAAVMCEPRHTGAK